MLIESGTRTNAIKSQGRIFRINSSIPRINTGGSSISGRMNIKANPIGIIDRRDRFILENN